MTMMELTLLNNLKEDIFSFEETGKRIRLEWIHPYCLGIQNGLDDAEQQMNSKPNRMMFCKLIMKISKQLDIPYKTVFNAFIGGHQELKSKLITFRKSMDQSHHHHSHSHEKNCSGDHDEEESDFLHVTAL